MGGGAQGIAMEGVVMWKVGRGKAVYEVVKRAMKKKKEERKKTDAQVSLLC